jgi:hypothetical protein
VKRWGSSISSSAEKLLEWPLWGVAEREEAVLEVVGERADAAGGVGVYGVAVGGAMRTRSRRWRSMSSCMTRPASMVFPRPMSSAMNDAGELEGLLGRGELVVEEVDASAEGGLEEAGVGGSDGAPLEGVEVGGEAAGLVEGGGGADATLGRADDAGAELALPEDGERAALGVIVEAGEADEGVLLADAGGGEDLIHEVLAVSDLGNVPGTGRGVGKHGADCTRGAVGAGRVTRWRRPWRLAPWRLGSRRTCGVAPVLRLTLLETRDAPVYTSMEGSLTMAETQISAYVSDTTKELVERYVEAHGVEKGRLLEEALLHHLQALRELPADLIVPPRLVVGRETFERVSQLIKRPRKPTKAMRALMGGKRAR